MSSCNVSVSRKYINTQMETFTHALHIHIPLHKHAFCHTRDAQAHNPHLYCRHAYTHSLAFLQRQTHIQACSHKDERHIGTHTYSITLWIKWIDEQLWEWLHAVKKRFFWKKRMRRCLWMWRGKQASSEKHRDGEIMKRRRRRHGESDRRPWTEMGRERNKPSL